jgi:uncharacterized protein YbbK (DUF523 family)
MGKNVIVSACLLGINCKYDGENNFSQKVLDYLNENFDQIIPVCPEQLGGLPTPRPACEIFHANGKAVLENQARVLCKTGEDVTENFIKGAQETLKIAKMFNCQHAVLKERSPSCGSNFIYDGEFCSNKKEDKGVTGQILSANGIRIESELDI